MATHQTNQSLLACQSIDQKRNTEDNSAWHQLIVSLVNRHSKFQIRFHLPFSKFILIQNVTDMSTDKRRHFNGKACSFKH